MATVGRRDIDLTVGPIRVDFIDRSSYRRGLGVLSLIEEILWHARPAPLVIHAFGRHPQSDGQAQQDQRQQPMPGPLDGGSFQGHDLLHVFQPIGVLEPLLVQFFVGAVDVYKRQVLLG